jgi:hypothetical protein
MFDSCVYNDVYKLLFDNDSEVTLMSLTDF